MWRYTTLAKKGHCKFTFLFFLAYTNVPKMHENNPRDKRAKAAPRPFKSDAIFTMSLDVNRASVAVHQTLHHAHKTWGVTPRQLLRARSPAKAPSVPENSLPLASMLAQEREQALDKLERFLKMEARKCLLQAIP